MALEIKILEGSDLGFTLLHEKGKVNLRMLKDSKSKNERYILWREDLSANEIHAYPLGAYSLEEYSCYAQIVHQKIQEVYKEFAK